MTARPATTRKHRRPVPSPVKIKASELQGRVVCELCGYQGAWMDDPVSVLLDGLVHEQTCHAAHPRSRAA